MKSNKKHLNNWLSGKAITLLVMKKNALTDVVIIPLQNCLNYL